MKRALLLVLLLMPAPARAADKVIGLISLPEVFWEETGPCDDQFKAQSDPSRRRDGAALSRARDRRCRVRRSDCKKNPKLAYRTMTRDAVVYVRGRIRHDDHATVLLRGWHRVYLNSEFTTGRVTFYD